MNAQWQPIETAPKDGKLFLCWVDAIWYGENDDGEQVSADASDHDFGRWNADSSSPDGGWYENMMGPIGSGQMITHWMPLPEPPK